MRKSYHFSEEQVNTLEIAVKEYREHKRFPHLQAVYLRSQNYKVDEVAKITQLSESSVKLAIRYFFKDGIDCVLDDKRGPAIMHI